MPQMEALLWLHLYITSSLLLLVVMCQLYCVSYKDLEVCSSPAKTKDMYWTW